MSVRKKTWHGMAEAKAELYQNRIQKTFKLY